MTCLLELHKLTHDLKKDPMKFRPSEEKNKVHPSNEECDGTKLGAVYQFTVTRWKDVGEREPVCYPLQVV